MIVLSFLLLFVLFLLRWLRHRPPRRGFRLKKAPATCARARPKPAWVQHEVLRLKALMPRAGCRAIGTLFNRLHAVRRRMTVSKSYVAYTVRKHKYEIEVLRREIKDRLPPSGPGNRLWAMDLSGKGTIAGETLAILGILDHGTRKLLALEAPANKNAWTLLGHLFLAIGRFGKPRAVRSDNEAMFRCAVFRTALRLAGIAQQLTVAGCPWQNGRIERLYLTLKQNLDRIEIESRGALAHLLLEFRVWYNSVRPHQHLLGRTPDGAWAGIDPYAHAPKSIHRFEGWNGMLTGYYLRH